ncbi:hypothetical protein AVEN_117111-1 [Araneus ventricosus]|uniref:Uncharacterized protein n=1 Tax=Araneus ventricosus TaxID=182803 RepID=A0A4Y2LKX2_ARAVE|nr:hypothetical protein AVEN_117111-1 [Araneus ventricosus]
MTEKIKNDMATFQSFVPFLGQWRNFERKEPRSPEVRQGWQEVIQPKRMPPEDDNYSGKYPQLFPKIQLQKINKMAKLWISSLPNRFGRGSPLIYIILLFDLQKICVFYPYQDRSGV